MSYEETGNKKNRRVTTRGKEKRERRGMGEEKRREEMVE